jgi:hypothetical protein
MAQREFTKSEADESLKALDELFEALPKSRRGQYLGHLNDISLFIGAAKKVAPEKPPAKKDER